MVPYFESTAASKERKAQRPVAAAAATVHTPLAARHTAAPAAATRRTSRARTITCFSSKPTIAEVAGLKAVVPFSTWSAAFYV